MAITIDNVILNNIQISKEIFADPNIYFYANTIGYANNSFNILLTAPLDVTVDWGDNTSNSYTTGGTKLHTYANAGNYLVTISGNSLNGFYTGTFGQDKIKSIVSFGDLGLTTIQLNQANGLQSIPNSIPSTVTNLSNCFSDCNVANSVFANIQYWNTASVQNMADMFANNLYFNQPIGNWNMSNVTTTANMFFNVTNFNQPIGNWNVSKVTDMSLMFNALTSFNQPIGNWNVSNVSNMYGIFGGANAFNQPIGNWNVSNVTNMGSMFGNARSFNQPIGNWNVSNVTGMSGVFSFAISFNQPIGNWDTSNANSMFGMFRSANTFNQNIGNWNTGNVTLMTNMFRDATVFNQNLTGWCVTDITSEPANFALNSALTANNKPIWGTCPP